MTAHPSNADSDSNPYASSWLLPPSVSFDEYCNRRQSQHILWAIATFVIIPLATTEVALHLRIWNGRWTDPQAYAVLIAAAVCTIAVQLLLSNFIYTYGDDVVQLLRGRFQAEGINPDKWDGICVTFTPADRPRQFQKGHGVHTVFDAGFVFLFDEALMFLGEKTSFQLPRASVQSIRLGTGGREIGWYPQRIYIDWFDPESQSVQTFNFGAAEGRSMVESRTRVIPEILDRIRNWHRGHFRGLPGIPNLAVLAPPDPALAANALTHARSLQMTLTGFINLAVFAGLVEAGVAWGSERPITYCVPLATLLSIFFLCSPMILSPDKKA